jgi:hypothetical protein
MVKGILAARMEPVIIVPSSGTPDESSKTEPTPAIAVIQEPSNNTPLLGVIDAMPTECKIF